MSRDPGEVEWSSSLSSALKAWAADHDTNGTELGKKIIRMTGISEGLWKHIYSLGDTITTKTQVYACLYVLTGLPQADPRFIPSGRSGAKSWTEEEYATWLKSKVAKEAEKLHREVAPEKEDNSLGEFFNEVVTLLQDVFLMPLAERQAFIKKYGRHIGRLDKYVSTLMQPEEDRELSIRMTLDSN